MSSYIIKFEDQSKAELLYRFLKLLHPEHVVINGHAQTFRDWYPFISEAGDGSGQLWIGYTSKDSNRWDSSEHVTTMDRFLEIYYIFLRGMMIWIHFIKKQK